MGNQQEKIMGLIMGDEISECSSACHIMGSHNARNMNVMCSWLFLFIFEHTITFCWVRFAGKMPASNILYNLLLVQEDEIRARIVNPDFKKIWKQQELNLWLHGERPAPKPLNHEDLLIFWRHHSSIWLNLLPLSFDLTCITPDVPNRWL